MKKIKEFVSEHIVKTKDGYKLVSKSSGKNLGTATSLAGIKKRESQVQYFKNLGEDGAPTNSAGSGQIAGIGVGPKGEPGVGQRKKPMLFKSFLRRKLPGVPQ